ncbi:helix-turn-helix transcriptional regulator [Morganella morganii]|uniref:helix-turn-helix transcriptional regulator n=1 Tax=Morganella morganii TaxID=582 RepID=UPI00062CA841|nr:LuxR C-terminal-related transcriptional regulator [Morganella morganii]KKY64530.1 hypothetical protein OA40_15975 [Morganella morganii]KNZ89522.1 hypothetical protein AKG16_03960 [Morganella morganii]NIH20671.1 hypothetical protein [Morganella morganii]
MSVEHAIDLSFRSQDLFVSSLKEIIKKSSYWMVCSSDDVFLLSNAKSDLRKITVKPEKDYLLSSFPLESVVFIEDKRFSIVSPYQLFKMPVTYNNKYCLLYVYFKILRNDFYHCFLKNDLFDKVDSLGNKLNFEFQVNRLKEFNPLTIFTNKEWLVLWLLIQSFSTNEIASILQLKPNTIKKTIDRVLGVRKLALFQRELFIEIAKYLGWDLLIPVFFSKKCTV